MRDQDQMIGEAVAAWQPHIATDEELDAFALDRGLTVDPDLPGDEKRAAIQQATRQMEAVRRFASVMQEGGMGCEVLAVHQGDVSFRVSLGEAARTIRVVMSEVMASERVARTHALMASMQARHQLAEGAHAKLSQRPEDVGDPVPAAAASGGE